MGNTSPPGVPRSSDPVHPHERGEYDAKVTQVSLDIGSSPRTWGIQFMTLQDWVNGRFIPTNVGNTTNNVKRCFTMTVHPHERGEYARVHASTWRMRGSSPRTWGIRLCLCLCSTHLRFIPTNVGNTYPAAGNAEQYAVHPHERGEYDKKRSVRHDLGGSSPRTWGIRCHARKPSLRQRFIPTNVGNTGKLAV